MRKQKMTIEKLAAMTQRGFNELRAAMKRGFAEVEKRFEAVDQRFDAIDHRFEGADKRFVGIEQRLVNLESDTSYLKSRVMEIGMTLNRHGELLEEHSEELRWLHKKIDEFFNPKSDKRPITQREFIILETRVSALEKKIAVKNK